MADKHYCGSCRCWKPPEDGSWILRGRGGRQKLWKCARCQTNAKKSVAERDAFGKHMTNVNRIAQSGRTVGLIAQRKQLEAL